MHVPKPRTSAAHTFCGTHFGKSVRKRTAKTDADMKAKGFYYVCYEEDEYWYVKVLTNKEHDEHWTPSREK